MRVSTTVKVLEAFIVLSRLYSKIDYAACYTVAVDTVVSVRTR